MKLLRLSGRKTCERVKTKGFLWKGRHFFVRYLLSAPRNQPAPSETGLFMGTLTSTRLHKSAVKRNRMRRRCREALRLTLRKNADLPLVTLSLDEARRPITHHRSPITDHRSFQLLLLPRSSSLSAAFGELLSDADRLITFLLHQCPTPRHDPRHQRSNSSSRSRSSSCS